MRNHYKFPDIVGGAPLEEFDKGWFGVLVPTFAINLVANPSFEKALTGYTAFNSAVLTQTSDEQRRGTYSGKVVTNGNQSGIYYTLAMTAGTVYTFSIDFKGKAGQKYRINFEPSGVVANVVEKDFYATGYWQRIEVRGAPVSTRDHLCVIRQIGGAATTFYTDGWQVVASRYPMSYIDGDLNGFLPGQKSYYWNGEPHASSSTRILDTGSGGREVKLLDIGFTLLAVVGLGLAPFSTIATSYSTGGAYYQNSIVQPRQFSLIGAIADPSPAQIERVRAQLIALFNPARQITPQPITLRYHRVDPCTNEETETIDIPCVYEGGLEGSVDNFYQDRKAIVFKQYLPALYADGEQGSEIAINKSIADTGDILYRSPEGVWSGLGSITGGTTRGVRAIAIAPDGSVCVAGEFTAAGGVPANNVALWDGSAWSALGDGLGSDVLCGGLCSVDALIYGPDGTLYAGGDFLGPLGPAIDYVAMWDGSDWVRLWDGGNTTNAPVYAFAFGPDGALYLGGNFTSAGGVAVNRIVKWDGTDWTALGTGMNGAIRALVFAPDGNLYAGGEFTTAGGVTVNRVAQWDGSAWSAMGAGMNAVVRSLAVGADGTVYAGGQFTTAGGLAAIYIAQWNGTSWSPMNGGVNNYVYALLTGPDHALYVGGAFTTAGGIAMPDKAAVWVNGIWTALDMDSPGSSEIYSFAYTVDRGLYVGGKWSGTTIASDVTTLDNQGSAVAYPVVDLTGPGRVWVLRSYTTGEAIFFDDLTLLAGETITLNLDPLNFSFTSNFRGDLAHKIATGSSVMIRILPGENSLSAFVTDTTAASAGVIHWRIPHDTIDAATR
jgi:hypothetical protein